MSSLAVPLCILVILLGSTATACRAPQPAERLIERVLRETPFVDGHNDLLLRRRAAQARVPAFTPHEVRRTFISDLLDSGADMVTVQKLARHSSIQTTARYDRLGQETKRRAAQLLHVPVSA